MSKRGTAFVCIVEDQQRQPAIWEPHGYRGAEAGGKLGDYIEVRRLRRLSSVPCSLFRAIEYSDISSGDHLTFTLEDNAQKLSLKLCAVGEQELLMGTMRAYLGNIIVTPRAEWLARKGPLAFAVKSEFVQVVPHDGLVYFWWAYLRSAMLLTKLPTGSGGTRPRLQSEALAATTVSVPDMKKRAAINVQLEACAAREWREMLRRRAIIHAARLAV
ncbi:MAG: hypothetical protein V7641_550 [Blastocatellia bacterium]